jgi:sulfur-oxidizing protein SoxY
MTKQKMEKAALGRRDILKAAGIGVLAMAGSGLASGSAVASPEAAAAAMKKMIGGAATTAGKVTIKLPEIAENGRTVPVTVSVDSPMTADDYVKSIYVLAEGNPNPEVVNFNLTPAVGKVQISTRMRLGKTQNVVAAAVMSDGTVYTGKKEVKVTIGGCGG